MVNEVKDKLDKLAFNFKLANYKSLNESQTRLSYIDKFWKALGWQVDDTEQVLVETVDKQSKRPDYRFLKGSKTLFFVEAKKPAEDLRNPKHIYQTKLYCWNGNVPLAILTDFEEFRPFRSIGKPNLNDAHKGLIKQFDLTFESYADKAEDLLNTFGREAVLSGSLNSLLKPTQIELRDTVDKDFLNTLSKWRRDLSEQIAKQNKFSNEFELSEAVQRILDRLVFLRILQDREIESEDFMCRISKNNISDTYPAFVHLCKELSPKYNGLIFNPHPLSENLKIESSLFKKIVQELDAEESPYRFDEIHVEVLGTIYERFLGDEIGLDKKGKVVIDQKPEVRKAGGVYYTPQYIVEYIVQNTVGKLLENCKTPDDVSKLKILDPACGSGSFLLGAFDALIKWHEDYFSTNPLKIIETKGKNSYKLAYLDNANRTKLSARMKGRILQNNLYGVDLDKQATEVAQMSLYIKVLEGMANEGVYVLGFQDAILPKLDGNIKCGNSLIGTDFIQDDFFGLSEREKHKINPFDWKSEFPFIRESGGFDAVIGNPPYIKTQNMQEFAHKEVVFYKNNYYTASSGNFDIYIVFIEKGFGLLNSNGILGFIVPHKFFNSSYGENLRKFILKNKSLNKILHFDDYQVFSDATTYTCLLFLNTIDKNQIDVAKIDSSSFTPDQIKNIDYFKMNLSKWDDKNWLIIQHESSEILKKIDSLPKLSDLCTNIFQGPKSGADNVFIFKKIKDNHDSIQLFSTVLNQNIELENSICKQYIKGKNTKRYYVDYSDEEITLFPYTKTGKLLTYDEIKLEFPYTFQYINNSQIKDILLNREHGRFSKIWWSYSRPQNMLILDRIKILTPFNAFYNSFSYDNKGDFIFSAGVSGSYGILLKEEVEFSYKYLLGILNSKIIFYIIKKISTCLRGQFYSFENKYIKNLPIRVIDFSNYSEKAQHDQIVELVERMLKLNIDKQTSKENDRKHIEQYIARTDKEIDQLVYKLYDLTDEEIKIVEGE